MIILYHCTYIYSIYPTLLHLKSLLSNEKLLYNEHETSIQQRSCVNSLTACFQKLLQRDERQVIFILFFLCGANILTTKQKIFTFYKKQF